MNLKSLRECIDIEDSSMIIHLIGFLKKTVRDPVMIKFGYGKISNSFKMNQLSLTFRWIFFGEPLEDESIEMQYDRFMRDTDIKDIDPNIDNLTYDDEINEWKSCNRKLILAKYNGGGPEELIAQHNYYHMNDPTNLLYFREIELS